MCKDNQRKRKILIADDEARLEAWLAFLCMDEPDEIISIIEKYSDFKAMYEQIYDICQNIEEVMGMFSKELRELDKNTAQLMIDEMQEELNQERRKVKQKDLELEQKDKELEQIRQEYLKVLDHIAELESPS